MEFQATLAVLWCALTYWLGGQTIPWFGRGFIQIRRYVMPLGLFLALLALKIAFWRAFAGCATLCAATHLGYQGKVWKYALTGALMGAGSLFVGIYWTCALPALFHAGFGYLSLKDNKFSWAYVGVLVGASIGIAFVIPAHP